MYIIFFFRYCKLVKDLTILTEKKEKSSKDLEKIDRALSQILEEIETDPKSANKASIRSILKKVLESSF